MGKCVLKTCLNFTEKKGLKPNISISWDDAKPTKTHMAIAKLVTEDKVKFVISQNIDGLHLRSGIPRSNLAELHGNMFVDECSVCKNMFVRSSAASTVGRKLSDMPCKSINRRPCRKGKLRDFVLDWEDELPDEDLTLSHAHSTLSELSIVIGSTLQIIPAGNMPTYCKKSSGKLVIINLQATKHDKKADLIIRNYADQVFELLFEKLGYDVPEYSDELDPVKLLKNETIAVIDWTQSATLAKEWEKKSSKLESELRQQRKLQKLLKLKEPKKELLDETKKDDDKPLEQEKNIVKSEVDETKNDDLKVEEENGYENGEENNGQSLSEPPTKVLKTE